VVHAAVVQVAIEPGSDPAHRHRILDDFVIPEVRSSPGFVKGLWLHDGNGTGTCVVVYETEEEARAGLALLTRPGGPPVKGAGLHEVEAEA
jgi:hypothetical protein